MAELQARRQLALRRKQARPSKFSRTTWTKVLHALARFFGPVTGAIAASQLGSRTVIVLAVVVALALIALAALKSNW
jgi:hypothetical protein